MGPVEEEEAAVSQQLVEIRQSIEANTRATQRSRVWIWMQWLTLAVLFGLGGLTWWDDHQDDRREEVQEERQKERDQEEARQDCLNGIEVREEGRQRLLEIAREINSQHLTEIINDSYEGSPPPAACD